MEAKQINRPSEEPKKAGRGGKRPNSGRPRKDGGVKRQIESNFPPDVLAEIAVNPNMTPLQYMLSIMRNPQIDNARRDRMAVAAAPYCHGKIMDQYVGKKEKQEEEAKTATEGWMRDLSWIDYRKREKGEHIS